MSKQSSSSKPEKTEDSHMIQQQEQLTSSTPWKTPAGKRGQFTWQTSTGLKHPDTAKRSSVPRPFDSLTQTPPTQTKPLPPPFSPSSVQPVPLNIKKVQKASTFSKDALAFVQAGKHATRASMGAGQLTFDPPTSTRASQHKQQQELYSTQLDDFTFTPPYSSNRHSQRFSAGAKSTRRSSKLWYSTPLSQRTKDDLQCATQSDLIDLLDTLAQHDSWAHFIVCERASAIRFARGLPAIVDEWIVEDENDTLADQPVQQVNEPSEEQSHMTPRNNNNSREAMLSSQDRFQWDSSCRSPSPRPHGGDVTEQVALVDSAQQLNAFHQADLIFCEENQSESLTFFPPVSPSSTTRLFYSKTHPCLQVLGTCRFPSHCLLKELPRNLCLAWFRGDCSNGELCSLVHRLPKDVSDSVSTLFTCSQQRFETRRKAEQQQSFNREYHRAL